MRDLWLDIPILIQNLLVFGLLIAPALVLGVLFLRGHRPLVLSFALIRGHLWPVIGFTILIALAVSIGVGLITQERSVRIGAAKAAEKFDLVVGAPGSETTLLFSSVYLQPNPLPLLDGATFDRIAQHERTRIAAPIALGDSYEGAIIVGTTADFVTHLGGLEDGQIWQTSLEAIAGIDVPLAIGSMIEPAHGHGSEADDTAHEGTEIKVVGRMARTHSPWDQAILVPVESVWETHGLANGHAPAAGNQIGPPFDAAYFPGASAVIVISDSFSGIYQIQSDFTADPATMAIIPGAVLGYLYRVLGDLRGAATILTWISLSLVAFAVLGGLAILSRLFIRHLAVLRAIGAPLRFVTATLWTFCAQIILLGSVLGCVGALISVALIGSVISSRTGLTLPAQFGWLEIHLVAAFASATLLAAAAMSYQLAKSARPETLRT